jgi:hypothetical protein
MSPTSTTRSAIWQRSCLTEAIYLSDCALRWLLASIILGPVIVLPVVLLGALFVTPHAGGN